MYRKIHIYQQWPLKSNRVTSESNANQTLHSALYYYRYNFGERFSQSIPPTIINELMNMVCPASYGRNEQVNPGHAVRNWVTVAFNCISITVKCTYL